LKSGADADHDRLIVGRPPRRHRGGFVFEEDSLRPTAIRRHHRDALPVVAVDAVDDHALAQRQAMTIMRVPSHRGKVRKLEWGDVAEEPLERLVLAAVLAAAAIVDHACAVTRPRRVAKLALGAAFAGAVSDSGLSDALGHIANAIGAQELRRDLQARAR
jgi:hypothetical protein